MDRLFIKAASHVTGAEARKIRLGARSGRMDLMSKLILVAVEALGIDFGTVPRERIALCLAVKTGSLSTDLEYWSGRDVPGGLSPTLFTYTLPSAALGELAIRHGLTGPSLCLVGDDAALLSEAAD